MKKALVALPDQVRDTTDRYPKGKLGTGYSDATRTVVLAYLSEKECIDKGGKPA